MSKHNIDAGQLSKSTDLSIMRIDLVRSGEMKPTLEILQRLSDYFGVSESYLLSGKEDVVVLAEDPMRNAYFKVAEKAEQAKLSEPELQYVYDLIDGIKKRKSGEPGEGKPIISHVERLPEDKIKLRKN